MTEVGSAPTSDGERPWAAVRRRLTRLRPDLVPRPMLAWAIACWVLTLAVIVAILVPGVTDAVRAEPLGETGVVGVFDAPLGLRLLVIAAGVVVAGASVVSTRARAGVDPSAPEAAPRRRDGVLREVVLAVAAAGPGILLLADRRWEFATAALVLGVAAEVVAHRIPPGRPRPDALVGLAATAPSVVLLVVQFTPEGGRSGSWVWIALFGFAAAFAAFGSYYGVARAAESRSKAVSFLFRRRRPASLVFGIALAAAALVALRMTLLRDLFREPDPTLWAPFDRPAITWLHAVLVGVLVVAIALRSSRRPLVAVGSRRITAALAVVGNTELAVGVFVIVVGLIAAAITGEVVLPEGIVPAVPWMKVAGVLVIAAIVALPRFRGTAARALGLVTAAYLVPLTLQNALVGVGADPAVATVAATPVQVTAVLVAAALAGSVVDLLRPAERRFPGSVLIRLAVVPLVAVHAGWLLPAAWSELGRILLVAGVLLAAAVLLPPVSPDRIRHGVTVLSAAAGQVFALAVFVLAIPSFLDDPQVVVLGLFWLTVAIVAALTIDTVERPARPAVAAPRSRQPAG